MHTARCGEVDLRWGLTRTRQKARCVHDYVVGAHPATSVPFPRGEGELHLQFACAVGARIGLRHAALHDSRIPEICAPRAKEIARRFR